MELPKPGYYRHFKGKYYFLQEIAYHSETLEPLAVYRALYGQRKLWVRPASMWNEVVDKPEYHGPRFVAVKQTDVPIESVRIADEVPEISYELRDMVFRSVFGEDAPIHVIQGLFESAAYLMPKQSTAKNGLNYVQLGYMLWAMVDEGLLNKKYCGMRRELTAMLATILEPEDAANNHLLEYFCGRDRPNTNSAQKNIAEHRKTIEFSLKLHDARVEVFSQEEDEQSV